MTDETAPAADVTTADEGRVIRLVTDDELLFNLGSNNGVRQGMIYNILDPATQNVVDPKTRENLGSLERIKAQVRVISVTERMSLGRVYPGRSRGGLPYSAETLMGPKPPSGKLSGNAWPDGVVVGDPVKDSGRKAP